MRASIGVILVLAALAAAGSAWCQSKEMSRGPHRMEITLERLDGPDWRAIDPGLVLNAGDRVRFRFRTNFDGHLYVMNSGTSGDYALLFPREDSGTENRIEGGKEYLIPATEAYFRVAGPPGQDVVYWLVSPSALVRTHVPLPPPPKPKGRLPNLIPRCDDALFRARGECIDSSAGPRQAAEPGSLPENLGRVPGATSRGLVIMRQSNQSVLSSPQPLPGPVIYEFRLAHR